MARDPNLEITQMLRELRSEKGQLMERLFPLVYDEMKKLARARMAQERAGHTLQATALVHEAYLRLVDQQNTDYVDRHHFFAIASQAIRRVLLDHARRRARLKRGGDPRQRNLVDTAASAWDPNDASDFMALDDALQALAASHPLAARVVELRFFAGLTHTEAADILEVSERTVRNHWEFARAWIFRRLSNA